jgi:hypothetical protein
MHFKNVEREITMTIPSSRPRQKLVFKPTVPESNPYHVATETLTVADKLKVLEALGHPELIEVFKDWRPRVIKKRRSAPLDQRVAITVTNLEKVSLDSELHSLKAAGEVITASQFIRNRALGTVDINGWAPIATNALKELADISTRQTEFRTRKRQLANLIEETDDSEEIGLFEKELSSINQKLGLLVGRNERRINRLSGRMSMAEAETVRWRAQRLCLSSSDYLRMMIFTLSPNSNADAHMSLDAKRRFYVSIIDVAENGWGAPPTIYECSQCGNYLEEIERLRDRIKQLETFV